MSCRVIPRRIVEFDFAASTFTLAPSQPVHSSAAFEAYHMLASQHELYAVTNDRGAGRDAPHALYNNTLAHPYHPPSSHDVDPEHYAAIRLETLQTIQLGAYNDLLKRETAEFAADIEMPFEMIKEDERWLVATRWRERSAALLAQCEGEKDGSVVRVEASASFDYGCAESGRDAAPSHSTAMVYSVGVQEEEGRIAIYRQWVGEYRAVLPLQKVYARLQRAERDALFKQQQEIRDRAAWLQLVVLDHVNAQEAVMREEQRSRDLLHSRGTVWLRRLCDQAVIGGSILELQNDWEPSMRAAIVYTEAMTRSHIDTSSGVLESIATLRLASSHQSLHPTRPPLPEFVIRRFDWRAQAWAQGKEISAEDALMRIEAEESMDRKLALSDEDCQRRYVLMLMYRDLKFSQWLADRVGEGIKVGTSRHSPPEQPRASLLTPMPLPPHSQPL